LRDKFYATNPTSGTPGTYKRPNGSRVWTKEGGTSITTFTTVGEFQSWLNNQPANTKTNPYTVTLRLSSLGDLGTILKNASNKYISLDFSGSTFTSIDNWAFNRCESLTSVTIPNSVTSITNYAFTDCSSLASITIPSSVTTIGSGTFGACPSLPAINVDAGNSAYASDNGVLYNKGKTVLHTYPAGRTGSSFTIPNKRKMTHFTQLQG